VKIIIKQKLIRTQIKTTKQRKWNQSNLQDPAMLKQYRTCLHNRLIGKEVQQDTEGEWTQIKETIIESANEVIQTQTTPNKNEWWDESCKLIVSQKNEARKKYLQVKTRATHKIYEAKRTEVCREKKRIWINKKIRQIEEASNKNDARHFFKEAQYFNKQKSVLPTFCKDKSGNILSGHGDILRRWRQYFCDLQTINTRTEDLISESIILSNAEEVPPPTYNEVNRVTEKLKIHTAAGSDNIPAELIKQGGTELKRTIHKLIMMIWDEETLPTEWTEGIICPIYMKGDRMICNKYRPITLLNVVYKIFSILINNRLSKTVESKLEDCQIGF